MLGVPLLGAIPEDTDVIVSTNRGEPLVLKKACKFQNYSTYHGLLAAQKLTLAGVAYEVAARRLVGMENKLLDLERPTLNLFERARGFFK